MQHISRRAVLYGSVATAMFASRSSSLLAQTRSGEAGPAEDAAAGAVRRFTMDLRCGSLGVSVDQRRAIELAAKYGFESVTPEPDYLAKLSATERTELLTDLREKKLVWGAAGLSVDFRKDGATFQNGLKQLPALATAAQQAGVTRIGTWLSPRSEQLTYMANFRQHANRLRECVRILNDHGLRFGMEYVGPKTLWASGRHSFVHSMAETKELIAEIGQPNVGIILDSWHWYTAHETADDLKTLTNADIIACDLNDAPAGIAVDEQIDNRRELPLDGGVIDLRAFLATLVELNYDGPIRAEPFNEPLNLLEDEPAVKATSIAMKKAFALIE